MSTGFVVGLDTDNLIKLIRGRATSAGVADANKPVILGADGLISATMMPPGVGGVTFSGQASEALSVGLVNLHNSSGLRVRRADASNGRPADGFVLTSYSAGETAVVYGTGQLLTGLSGLTPGAKYVLSWTTAGAVALASSFVILAGRTHQFVGTANTTTSLLFIRGEDYLIVNS